MANNKFSTNNIAAHSTVDEVAAETKDID